MLIIWAIFDINELADMIANTNAHGIRLRDPSVKTMFLLCNALACNVAKKTLKQVR